MSEKRTEQRIPLMARVDILWMDDLLTPRVTPATLEDRSQGGVSLRVRSSISLGTHITIKSGTLQYSGVVTNTRRDKGGFMIGVKLIRREEPKSK
ncbi:MAG TPA: PilZ domain-containing protein [Candidatus Acidoferrales bacterium]|nr:PilZ domain-containing protein [Candidatus Acidoferrales bacterium]